MYRKIPHRSKILQLLQTTRAAFQSKKSTHTAPDVGLLHERGRLSNTANTLPDTCCQASLTGTLHV